MSETPRDDIDYETAAQMQLTPDDLHEGEDGLAIDCPECGSIAPLQQIVTEGRCNARLDDDATETMGEDQELPCTANLALELLWESD